MSISTYTMPLGPVHVALEEPVYFNLTVEGEDIKEVELTSGHVHRGMEQLAMKRNLIKNVTLTERVCSLCSNSHSFTYSMVVENCLNLEIPERAKYLRVLAEEIKRVASHLFNTAIQAHIAGFKSLKDLEFKYLDHPFINSVYLSDLDITLPVRIPRYRDSSFIVEDDIDEVCLWIDTDNSMEEKYTFVSNLTANDFMALKSHIDDNYCGVIKEVTIDCPHCGKAHRVKIEINDQNLFNNVDLSQILETITRIAKYSNLQITNDWSWVEVEVEQQIINKMINEENEANQKEIAKAKSQMPSMGAHRTSAPSMPSMPSVPHF